MIVAVISDIYEISVENILLVSDIADAIPDDSTKIICEMVNIDGDFKQHLSLYVQDDNISCFDCKSFAINICKMLKTDALISDDNVDPYTMTLVNSEGTLESVNLDIEQMNNDKYVIQS